ncbi:iripin-3-like [Parasteatoda tepidariorum]|uniref:iripin-3-like n=1 Tax=Parasteatoda tepidariorum TaxID=114398 RepID=UPI00077FC86C
MVFYNLFLLIIAHAMMSSAEVSQEDLRKFAVANNILAAKLYPRLINGNADNVFFCPASLLTGLGILLYGARGNTQKELYSVLGYEAAGLPLYKVPSTYNYYFSQMLPENIPNLVNYTLYCADEVLVTDRAPLYSQFQEEAQNLYDSTIQNVNFFNTNVVTSGINNFVNQHTHGKIHSIVNSVDSFSSALLIDAAFFKGKWETPFPPYLSLPQPFYSPTETKNVPFMQVIHSFPYFKGNNYQALLLPYIGGNIGLLILLPQQKNGLACLEKSMTPDNIVNVLSKLQSQKTMVLLPKFKFQYYRDFSKDFEALGAESAYDGSGDFSGMTFSKGLAVSGTLHKTALEVDESNQGAGMTVDFSPPIPPTILANHPFMFAVVDIRINLLIFLGRVINVDFDHCI